MSENEKKCKDCINCDVCLNIDRLILFDKNQPAHCKAFKDKSLFVEMPQNVNNDREKIIKGLDCCIIGNCMDCPYAQHYLECRDRLMQDVFVFLTKEDAEAKLKEIEGK